MIKKGRFDKGEQIRAKQKLCFVFNNTPKENRSVKEQNIYTSFKSTEEFRITSIFIFLISIYLYIIIYYGKMKIKRKNQKEEKENTKKQQKKQVKIL